MELYRFSILTPIFCSSFAAVRLALPVGCDLQTASGACMYEKLKAQSFLLPSSSRVALKATAKVATTMGKLSMDNFVTTEPGGTFLIISLFDPCSKESGICDGDFTIEKESKYWKFGAPFAEETSPGHGHGRRGTNFGWS